MHSVTVIGIVRLAGVVKLFYIPQPDKDPYYDLTVTLSVVEANIAIVSASAPALRPLFRSLLPGLFGGSSARYAANKYNNNYANSKSPYYSGMGGGSVAGGPGAGAVPGSAIRHGQGGETTVSRGGSIHLKNLRGNKNGRDGHTECRSVSPSGSEEEIMTYNGIMRTTDVRVQVHFEAGENSTLAADTDRASRASSDLKGGAKVEVEKGSL